jgi:hypothetical protein
MVKAVQISGRKESLMLEKDIVSAILRYLKTVPDCFCWKQHGGMYGVAGLPDIIACINGRFAAFEVKTPSGRLTKLQESMIAQIKAAKGEAFKVTSVEEVKGIVKLMTDWRMSEHE